MLAATANALVRVFLAPTCAACDVELDRPLASPVCAACWRAVQRLTPPYCTRCGDAIPPWRSAAPLCARCRRHAPVFALARSAGRYEGSLRRIIQAFKYDRRRALAAPLARLMLDGAADVLRGADAVVPVPLHPWRAWHRGFNQADDLARHLGPPVWTILARTRRGPPQASLPASQRHANVRGAYRLRRGPPYFAGSGIRLEPYAAHRLRNRTVVLIDDVMTTGATMEECGRVLREAGVRSVRALTVARAVAALPVPPPPTHRLGIEPR